MQVLRFVSWSKVVVFMLVVFPIVFGHVSTVVCQGMASISGQMKTQDGGIIPFGVTVRLETSQGQMVAVQPVDSDGHYEFDGLHKLNYQMVVTASGFQTAEREANLRHSADDLTVNVFLTPRNKIQFNKGDVTSVAELKVPPRAKKGISEGTTCLQGASFFAGSTLF